MKTDVETAIAQLRCGLPGHAIRVKEDNDGGAFVVIDDLGIGANFDPSRSWIGFHITFPYPDADVYPHFLDAAVRYVGSAPTPNTHPDGDLPTPLTRGAQMPGFDLPAIQVSRKSNHRNPDDDTALHKLLRILDFLRHR